MEIVPGMVFGRWTVLEVIERPKGSKPRRWIRCQCACGTERNVNEDNLKRGLSKSCGCAAREFHRNRLLKHGHSSYRKLSREYRAWSAAKRRCTDPTCHVFPRYGGRGIRMAPEWERDFLAFYRDMGPCPPGYTLDRINNDGNYEPGNCRWAPRAIQARNHSRNVVVTYNGKEYVLKDLAEELGVPYKRLHRLYRTEGYSLEDAIKAAMSFHRRTDVLVTFNGETLTLKDVARRTGKDYPSLHYFYRRRGMSLDEAIARARSVGQR